MRKRVKRLWSSECYKAQRTSALKENFVVHCRHVSREMVARMILLAPFGRFPLLLASALPNWQETGMSQGPAYPLLRMRRLRRHDWSRRLVAECTLSPADFIWPLFVVEGEKKREPVASMPGVDRLSVDMAVEAAETAARLGIPVVALFPFTDPALKTDDGREATNPDNLVCRAVRAIKRAVPEIGVLCDVALD